MVHTLYVLFKAVFLFRFRPIERKSNRRTSLRVTIILVLSSSSLLSFNDDRLKNETHFLLFKSY